MEFKKNKNTLIMLIILLANHEYKESPCMF